MVLLMSDSCWQWCSNSVSNSLLPETAELTVCYYFSLQTHAPQPDPSRHPNDAHDQVNDNQHNKEEEEHLHRETLAQSHNQPALKISCKIHCWTQTVLPNSQEREGKQVLPEAPSATPIPGTTYICANPRNSQTQKQTPHKIISKEWIYILQYVYHTITLKFTDFKGTQEKIQVCIPRCHMMRENYPYYTLAADSFTLSSIETGHHHLLHYGKLMGCLEFHLRIQSSEYSMREYARGHNQMS